MWVGLKVTEVSTMTILSHLDASTYLYELRQSLGSPTDYWNERFTGIVLGRFICITHHCGNYDWEQRFRFQTNTAIGIVKKASDGCIVRFITTKSILRPLWLIPAYLIVLLVDILFIKTFQFAIYYSCILTISALLSALIESMTAASKDGYKSLVSLLKNPQNQYENL